MRKREKQESENEHEVRNEQSEQSAGWLKEGKERDGIHTVAKRKCDKMAVLSVLSHASNANSAVVFRPGALVVGHIRE